MTMVVLTGKETPEQITETVKTFDVLLSASALRYFLKNFTAGRLEIQSLISICSELEHESVIYEPGRRQLIASILFEISSPEINGFVSIQRCVQFIRELEE